MALHVQIRGDAALGRFNAGVTEVVANDGGVHAELKEGDGTAATKHVGIDAATPQAGQRLRRRACVSREDVRGAVAREGFAAGVAKARSFVRSRLPEKDSRRGHCLGP
jgi:hypothetical protein